MQSHGPLLSICIPAYNGLPHIIELLDQILSGDSPAFEVVVSDDASTDGTWAYLVSRSANEPRLRVQLNAQNLGMDRNFVASVAMARGKFVWLCGQDDLIAPEGIRHVLDLLKGDDIDFVFMNHTFRLENEAAPPILPNHTLDADKCGTGIRGFLDAMNGSLPTFLPTYIIRKSLWDPVDATRYFNTYYVQTGVFLEVAEKIRWMAVSRAYVVGLVQTAGWQGNMRRFTNIVVGYFLMIARASKKSAFCESYIKEVQYQHHFMMLAGALLNCRREGIDLDAEKIRELHGAFRKRSWRKWLIYLIVKSPRIMIIPAGKFSQMVRRIRNAGAQITNSVSK